MVKHFVMIVWCILALSNDRKSVHGGTHCHNNFLEIYYCFVTILICEVFSVDVVAEWLLVCYMYLYSMLQLCVLWHRRKGLPNARI